MEVKFPHPRSDSFGLKKSTCSGLRRGQQRAADQLACAKVSGRGGQGGQQGGGIRLADGFGGFGLRERSGQGQIPGPLAIIKAAGQQPPAGTGQPENRRGKRSGNG